MSNTDTFCTYTGSYINGLGRATVIITVDKNAKPYAYSECFAFLENDALIYDEFGIECETSDVLNHIDLVKEAVFRAEKRLCQKLRKQDKNSPEHSFSKLIALSKESDNNAILGLIMRNKFSEEIAQVMKKTKSEEFRSFLNEHKTLPKLKFIYNDL